MLVFVIQKYVGVCDPEICMGCNYAYAVPRQQLLINLRSLNCNLVSDDDILNCIIVGSKKGKNSEDCIRLN